MMKRHLDSRSIAPGWINLLALAAISLSRFAVADQLIAYEGFAYDKGQSLEGAKGGIGWKGEWFGPKGVTGLTITETGMSFANLSVTGGKSLQAGTDARLFRYLDVDRPEVAQLVENGASGKTFGKDGTTIWISFLISCTSYPKLAYGGMHLMDGVHLGPDYKKTQRIQLGRQNMGTHWLLCRTDQGGPAAGKWDGTVTSDQTVRLLVYRFDFKPGAEEGWMWVDPQPGQAPDTSKADLHAPSIADFRFNAVNVGSGGGATFDFDELRIGDSFMVVAPTRDSGK